MADFEQEKFDLQKFHTRAIQDLLEDTNGRLSKMEAEYNAQATANVIKLCRMLPAIINYAMAKYATVPHFLYI